MAPNSKQSHEAVAIAEYGCEAPPYKNNIVSDKMDELIMMKREGNFGINSISSSGYCDIAG